MRFLALAALLALPAAAQDDFAAAARDGGVQGAIAKAKDRWSAPGAQEAAARGGATAPGGTPPASAPAMSPEQVLSNWAHRCPAIAAFRASRGAPSPKRGIGVSYHVGNGGAILANLRSSWYYTWGTKPAPGAGPEAKFVPMIYGIGNGTSDVEKNLREVGEVRPSPEFVLAYNEPDLSQHIAADDKTWAKSYAPGLPPGAVPVSPASSAVNDWFRDFMKGDNAAPFQHVAIHLYQDIQSDDPDAVTKAVASFTARLQEVKRQSKKPVWVTEFGLATWRATKERPAKFTDEQAACFMAQVVPILEKQSERYAWFSPGPDGKNPLYPTLPDALWNLDGSLTPLGELYRQ